MHVPLIIKIVNSITKLNIIINNVIIVYIACCPKGDEPNQFLQGYAMILKRTIADKNVQVSLRSGDLLQAVAHTLSPYIYIYMYM